ncbi:hypothetical protein D3C76_1487100 [compost metagenome]
MLGAVAALAQLLDRQRVHVGADADTGAFAVAQGTDHAGTAQAAMHLDAEAGQQLGDLVAGLHFLKAQLRRRVELTPPAGGVFDQVG